MANLDYACGLVGHESGIIGLIMLSPGVLIRWALFPILCVVPKPLALYTHLPGMGKRNKVVKITK